MKNKYPQNYFRFLLGINKYTYLKNQTAGNNSINFINELLKKYPICKFDNKLLQSYDGHEITYGEMDYDGLSNLIELHLKQNKIEKLFPGFFIGLSLSTRSTFLKLNLLKNPIQFIESKTAYYLSNLDEFLIDQKYFKDALKNKALANNLTFFYSYQSKSITISKDFFILMPNLIDLYLADNQI